MGFPQNWCVKALDINNNNVDSALTWILAHGDELGSDEDVEGESETVQRSEASKGETMVRVVGPNPLTVVSGAATVTSDGVCSMPGAYGFPSVGCRGLGVLSGKWYYEVLLCTAGCIQIGWVDGAYDGNADNGEGVGDDPHSWAYDGWRVYLWHE